MGRNVIEDGRFEFEPLQEFQAIQQTAGIGGVSTHCELAQPDKPGDPIIDHLRQQAVKLALGILIKPINDPGLNPPFCGNQGICA